MSENWTEKFNNRLLTASQENQDSEKALSEWRFTGSIIDHGKPNATCGVCGNHGLRYHFRIVNQITGEAIWVGSQCILNFESSPSAQSIKPSSLAKRSQNKLKHKIDDPAIANLILPLKQLYHQTAKGDRRKIHWAVGKFQRRGKFSPKDLAWLFQAMNILTISFEPKDFPLSLKNKQDRLEYSQLTITARALIEPCLPKSHSPPPKS